VGNVDVPMETGLKTENAKNVKFAQADDDEGSEDDSTTNNDQKKSNELNLLKENQKIFIDTTSSPIIASEA